MHVAVLGASGGTGLQLVQQALDRGHVVTAIARDPARLELTPSERLRTVAGDVTDPDSIARALEDVEVVLSGLGVRKGDTGTLTLGAQALVRAAPTRIVWLGALGTGESAQHVGAPLRLILGVVLKAQLPDKVEADAAALKSGATVFHAGPLADGPVSSQRSTVPLATAPRRAFPKRISRATVAAAMLDEAEQASFLGQIVVPLAG